MFQPTIVNNHFLFYENKIQEFYQKTLNDIKREYETKDWEIFHSQWRKKQGYIPHGTRKRTIITIFGKLTYHRHRYRYWNNNKYHFVYLADTALGIEKYQRLTNHLKLKILALVGQGKRYQDILDCFPQTKLTYQTLHHLIKNVNLNAINHHDLTKLPIKETLYVSLDDTFLNLKVNNKKQKFRIRVVLFHTGYQDKSNHQKPHVLANKRIFYFLNHQKQKINTKNFMKKIYQLAQENYRNLNNAKIIISGDGAPWIRQATHYWHNSHYVLDKFHALRKLKYLFNPKNPTLKPQYQQLKDALAQGNYENIMTILQQTSFYNTNKQQSLNHLKVYFTKNKTGIANQTMPNNIGCSIENTISHNFKALLGYGSKAFSKIIYQKILHMHLAQTNKINVLKILQTNMIKQHQTTYNFWKNTVWTKPGFY